MLPMRGPVNPFEFTNATPGAASPDAVKARLDALDDGSVAVLLSLYEHSD
ncbi:MAG: hypothetical protein L3K17_03745 [Thermoplasmata archaeon]|nr:hypothetical protein [Thermoplasmata archaeon]